ncbi:MAG: IclR family transcriptional regulator [Desulfuromonadales bacterium]|nr:IclR family transcriptional regulator [Desulfuromonadales bacterium]
MIQSVKRATDITSLFTASQTSLGITQIAEALGLNKATVWGLVTTLEKQGFLQQDAETHKYSLGPKMFELGMVYIGSLEINAKASRLAHGLASRTRLNARVAIWSGGTALITLLALPKAEDSFSRQIGPRVPAYCSAVGKALLAFLEPEQIEAYLRDTELLRHTPSTIVTAEELLHDLEQIRQRGYAISAEEMIPGVTALGAPIFGRRRQLVGSISLSAPPAVMAGATLDTLADELLRTAAAISQEMGYYKDLTGIETLRGGGRERLPASPR